MSAAFDTAFDTLTDCTVVAHGADGEYTLEFERAGATVRAQCIGTATEIGQMIQVNENLGTLDLEQVNDLSSLA